MATQGSEWKVTKSEILEMLKKHEGRITYAAKELKVCYETLLKYVKKFDLVNKLEEIRSDAEDAFIDLAENSLKKALKNHDNDVAHALKSAFFVLNSKGKKRGWTNTQLKTESPSVSDVEAWGDKNK